MAPLARFAPGYPDHRAAWNLFWEAQILSSPLKIKSSRDINLETESMLSTYRIVFRDLCGAQRDLAFKVKLIEEMDFSKTWQTESRLTREKHMLEGHIRACEFLKTDAPRIYSVDVTLESLEKNNGNGLLKLLQNYTLNDFSCYPETPLSYPFPGCNNLRPTSDPSVKVAREMYTVFRDQYLCFFLLFTIMSYYDAPMPPIPPLGEVPVRGPDSGKPPKPRGNAEVPVKTCEGCELPKKGDTPLLQCSRCRNVDLERRTWYCSKECQKADWPRHKQICGKKLTLETARSTAIPPTPNGRPM